MKLQTVVHTTVTPYDIDTHVQHFLNFEEADQCWHREMTMVEEEGVWSVTWTEFDTDTGVTKVQAQEGSELT